MQAVRRNISLQVTTDGAHLRHLHPDEWNEYEVAVPPTPQPHACSNTENGKNLELLSTPDPKTPGTQVI